jgi:hypothetical protein
MENTGQPTSPTARETIRAITLPLMLITLGSLFLIENSGGPPVRQTWPVLLIISGGAWALTHLVSR